MLDLFPSRAAGPFGRQLKHARGMRIPVTIVTGFLGAGKTTLVRRFLDSPEGHGTAVVINEFGAVGIDDALVRASTDEVTLLGNGCLCCTTRSDTSRQTFATDRALGGEFFVEVVAAVVDASCGLATLDWSAEARKQVILADRLVISKTDLCEPEATAALIARLTELNGYAPIDTAIAGELDPRRLIEAAPDEPAPHAGFIGETGHSDGVLSFVLSETAPLIWQPFERAMETLIALRGRDLLRVKGFLNVAGCRGPVLVQIVQHLAHPPLELASWPDQDHSSRLVFITRNITQEQVSALLRAVRALAVEAPSG